jgi:hypothetical protein
METKISGRSKLMFESDQDLGQNKEAAILALLSSRSIEEAARAAGVTARTLHRWITEPGFNAAFREARRAVFFQAIARLQQMSAAAATTLGKVMLDPATPPATRIRAADSILIHTARAIETEDIEVRLSALERAAAIRIQVAGSDEK